MSHAVEVIVTHLEMRDPQALRRADVTPAGVRIERIADADAPAWARRCYREIGGPWHWTDRAAHDDATWRELLDEERGEVWVARRGAALIGYFQLAHHGDVVELRYFGLVPEAIGQGIGGWLLSRAVECAWSGNPARIVLNTCTLDNPAALPNYLRRGFTVVREERRTREVA